MTYYVSPAGSDANPGTTAESALRSLTRAIELIVAAHGEVVDPPETIEVAGGTYAAEYGEVFPIIVPVGVEVRGAGRTDTVIEHDAIDAADIYLDLRGTLTEIAIRPRSTGGCDIDLRCTDEHAIVRGIAGNVMDFRHAREVSDVEFVSWVGVGEGFRSGGELYPYVQNCVASDVEPYDSRLVVSGGRIERCAARFVWLVSPGDTAFQSNRLGDALNTRDGALIVVRTREEPPTADEPLPQILNNYVADTVTFESGYAAQFVYPTFWVCGESRWVGNSIQAEQFVVASGADFTDNPCLAAGQFEIRRATPWWSLPDTADPPREIAPRFTGNNFYQIPFYLFPGSFDWVADETAAGWRPASLLWIGADARPVFADNTFNTLVGSVCIQEQAAPDFGGGTSRGGNRFVRQDDSRGPLFYPDVLVDIGEGNSLSFLARDNEWWRDRVMIARASGTVTADTDPTSFDIVEPW